MSAQQVIKLEKDQVIELTKETELTKGVFGLGWKPTPGVGKVDLDASCLCIGADGKAFEWVFYGHKSNRNNSINLDGDDLTGADNGEGANAPDENITIDLAAVPSEAQQLLLIVHSYSGQTFGAVQDVFCRVSDYYSNTALVEYDLDASYSNDKGIVVAKLQRMSDGVNWSFQAVGIGFKTGIGALLQSYGMNVG